MSFLRCLNASGAALITALFIMALIAAASVAMLEQERILLNEVTSVMNSNRALQVAMIEQNWARNQLLQNLTNTTPPIDTIPIAYPKTKINGGHFSGQIMDAQAKFNLNTLSSQSAYPGFLALLKTVLPSLSSEQATALLNEIANWISPTPNLALDERYKKLPYKVLHQPMVDISQLRQLIGVTEAIYIALLPYVTALPSNNTSININTAPAGVLMSLSGNNLSLDTMNSIIENRPFKTLADFYALDIVKNHNITGLITTQSDYFFNNALVKLDQQTLLLTSLLWRTEDQQKPVVIVMYQSF